MLIFLLSPTFVWKYLFAHPKSPMCAKAHHTTSIYLAFLVLFDFLVAVGGVFFLDALHTTTSTSSITKAKTPQTMKMIC